VLQPYDHVEGRGLACSIRTQQADNFTFLDVQTHIVNNAAPAVSFL
jgi:hypothetical protein